MSYNLNQVNGLTSVLGNPTVSAQTAGATTYTCLAFPYSHKGIARTAAAVTTGALDVTTDAKTGAAITFTAPASGFYTAAVLLWLVNGTSDSKTVVLGPKKTYATTETVELEIPAVPPGYVAFCVNTLRAGSTVSGTWTLGSQNWNATGMTASAAINLTNPPAGVVTITSGGTVALAGN
jgi:hypothetical protein